MTYSIKQSIIIILLAFFVISQYSNYIFVKYVGFNSIELIIIPLLILFPQYIKNIKYNDVIKSITIVTILWVLSVFFLPAELDNTLYNTIRSYFLFFGAFYIIYRGPIIDFKYLYLVALLSKFGDILSSISILQAVQYEQVITNANFLTTPIVLAYAYKKKTTIHFIFVSFLCLIASFLSITRGILLYTIIDILLVVILNVNSIRKFIKIIFVFLIIIPITYYLYISSENQIKEISPSFHHRMYTKILNKNDKNVVTGDDDRVGHITYIFQNIEKVIIPHGLPSRFAGSDFYFKNNRLLYSCQDSSIVELVYTYGIFLIPILLSFLRLILFFLQRIRRSDEYYIVLICLLNILIALPMGYGLIIFPSIIVTLATEMAIAYKIKKSFIYKNS